MRRRAPLKIIRDLEEAVSLAKMGDRASFGFKTDRLYLDGGPDNGQSFTVDEFIKERTRLYRQTWLIPKLEQTLAWAKGEEP